MMRSRFLSRWMIGACSALFAFLAATAFAQPLTQNDLMALIDSSHKDIEERISRPQVFVAISLSMPEGSLLRLAHDAKDAGVPLIVRGVPVQPKKVDKPNPTMKELYGTHLLVRGMAAYEFLTKTGVTLQIDPRLFDVHGINDVPQLVMVSSASEGNSSKLNTIKVRGDVTLCYALEHVHDSLKAKAKTAELTSSERELLDYTRVLLNRLGGRP